MFNTGEHGKQNTRIGDRIYHSQAWRRLRRYYYGTQHGICERCGEPGDIVHHIIPITPDNINDPMITLHEDNLELLCHECHNREHKKGDEPIREDVQFDEFGQLIKRGSPEL